MFRNDRSGDMMRILFISILICIGVNSCTFFNAEENQLVGKWDFQKVILPDNRIFSAQDSTNTTAGSVYEFFRNNMYLKESLKYTKGDGELIVKRGKYEVTSEGESLYLTLKEKQIEGATVVVFKVLTLNETDLILENERKSRYFFKKDDSGE